MTDVGQEQEGQNEDSQLRPHLTINKTKASTHHPIVVVDAAVQVSFEQPTTHELGPRSDPRSLFRRTLSTVSVAKPDRFWFQICNQTYYPRFELPSNNEAVIEDWRFQFAWAITILDTLPRT
jgi:hypothetical protein